MSKILKYLTCVGLALLISTPLHAADLPTSLSANGDTLSLNGSGVRTKLFIKLYKGGLYLKAPSKDAAAIINADEAMGIRLAIVSGLITAEKMENATMEGFENATGGQLAPIAGEIDQFMDVFRQGIENGYKYDLVYQPGTGTVVSKNGQVQATIGGLPFKQALFGIWLGDKPAQGKLKKGMLGK